MADSEEPVNQLEHGHLALNRSIEWLRKAGDALQDPPTRKTVLRSLEEVTGTLFEHFAKEEEGLFPFVREVLPDQRAEIDDMLQAHDSICGAASRLLTGLRSSGENQAQQLLVSLLERFAEAYVTHSHREINFLRSVREQLSDEQREQLAALLRAL